MMNLKDLVYRLSVDRDLSPFRDDQWMVILFLSNPANLVCKFQGLNKAFELKAFFQALHSIHFFHPPLVDLEQKTFDLGIGESRLAAAASHTFPSCKVHHFTLLPMKVHQPAISTHPHPSSARAGHFCLPRPALRNHRLPGHESTCRT